MVSSRDLGAGIRVLSEMPTLRMPPISQLAVQKAAQAAAATLEAAPRSPIALQGWNRRKQSANSARISTQSSQS